MTDEQKVRKDTVVTLNYTVALDNGEVIDSSAEGAPLQYVHGQHNIIPGLEKALDGMESGESAEVTITPEEAYGERVEDAASWYPRDAFPVEDLEPGMAFQVEDEEGDRVMIFIEKVEEERVLVDYNHPLAGETLHFDVTVLDVRPATPEELAHGHVHHEGHHH